MPLMWMLLDESNDLPNRGSIQVDALSLKRD